MADSNPMLRLQNQHVSSIAALRLTIWRMQREAIAAIASKSAAASSGNRVRFTVTRLAYGKSCPVAIVFSVRQ
ncbi:hypothetical protein V6N13_105762 [Hibiscus sabdariffa]